MRHYAFDGDGAKTTIDDLWERLLKKVHNTLSKYLEKIGQRRDSWFANYLASEDYTAVHDLVELLR